MAKPNMKSRVPPDPSSSNPSTPPVMPPSPPGPVVRLAMLTGIVVQQSDHNQKDKFEGQPSVSCTRVVSSKDESRGRNFGDTSKMILVCT